MVQRVFGTASTGVPVRPRHFPRQTSHTCRRAIFQKGDSNTGLEIPTTSPKQVCSRWNRNHPRMAQHPVNSHSSITTASRCPPFKVLIPLSLLLLDVNPPALPSMPGSSTIQMDLSRRTFPLTRWLTTLYVLE